MQCRGCSEIFNSEHKCRLHFFTKHYDKTYTCDVCKRGNYTKSQLGFHMKQSHINNPQTIPCPQCDKKFIELETLMEHQKTHQVGDIPRDHVCPQCSKRYRTKQDLRNHMNRHAGIRAYPCSYCEKAFYSSHNKKVHEYIHTGAPYRCRACDSKFNQLSVLYGHAKNIHGITDREVLKRDIIEKDPILNDRGRKTKKKNQVEDEFVEISVDKHKPESD